MPPVTWGEIGSIIVGAFGVAGGLASFYFGTRNSLATFNTTLGTTMARLDKNVETMNKVVMDLALSTQRQDTFEKYTTDEFSRIKDEIRDLKHGRGLIRERDVA